MVSILNGAFHITVNAPCAKSHNITSILSHCAHYDYGEHGLILYSLHLYYIFLNVYSM